MYDWRNDPTRKPGTRQTLTVNGHDYGFCWIPSGEFMMGSPDPGQGWEYNIYETLHHVTLTRGFWMMEKPVSKRLFRSIMGNDFIRGDKDFDSDDYPICYVTYLDAILFCQKLTAALANGLRADLPTEAQWEYACRAGTTTAYNFGDEYDHEKACFGRYENKEKPCRMGCYDPNAWGLYDMHGLVWERCKDLFGTYPITPVVDPQGLVPDDWRDALVQKIFVIRGGSQIRDPYYARSAYRGQSYFYDKQDEVGLRPILYSVD